jgi:CPA2 family monovalent cation:H+ antiporter-2
MLLGESPFAVQVRADVSGLRTLFVTVFFSSIGALGDPGWMLANWHMVSGAVVAIILGKSLITWRALRLFGAGSVSALAAGVCLGQIGEFSFVIAEIARRELLTHDVFLLIVSSTIVTMLLTPYLVAVAPRAAGRLLGSRGSSSAGVSRAHRTTARGQVLVIGFGPAGRVVGEQLREQGAYTVVLDLNPHIVANARQLGFTAFLGDGQHEDVLVHAGVRVATAIVVTVPVPSVAIDIVRVVRSIAPNSVIVARSRFNRYCSELGDAGADVVLDEETHIGKRMSQSVRELLWPDDTSAGDRAGPDRALPVSSEATPSVGEERDGET